MFICVHDLIKNCLWPSVARGLISVTTELVFFLTQYCFWIVSRALLGDCFVDYQNPCVFLLCCLCICVTVDCRLTESVRYCTDVVTLVVPLYLISVRVLATLCNFIVVP